MHAYMFIRIHKGIHAGRLRAVASDFPMGILHLWSSHKQADQRWHLLDERKVRNRFWQALAANARFFQISLP